MRSSSAPRCRRRRLLEQSPDGEKFRGNVLSHFNYATLENDLKWPGFLENPELARKGVEWLSAHNISIRGHNLIWPSFTSRLVHAPAVVQKYKELAAGDPQAAKKYLRETCADRVLSVTREFSGRIRDWT